MIADIPPSTINRTVHLGIQYRMGKLL